MHKLELKIPPVLVFLIATGTMYLCSLIASNNLSLNEYRIVLIIIFASMGVTVGVAGVVTFKLANTTVNPVSIEKASRLVTMGIFRYTRNPMYLGLILILISSSIYFNTNEVLSLMVLITFVVYMNKFQIKPEERMLAKLFGQAYINYLAETRPWI